MCLQGGRIHAGDKLHWTAVKEIENSSMQVEQKDQVRKDNQWLILGREREF